MIGLLSKKWCDVELEVQVLRCGIGFFIGTCNESGLVTRESAEYYRSSDGAAMDLANNSFVQRHHI